MIRQGPDFLVDKDGKKESVAAAETEPRAGSADLKRIATFKRIQTWIFDLDNTLYPHHLNLWQQVDVRIRNYIVDFLKVTHEEAFRVQKDYYRRYGTTLRGLMEEHDLDPDSFLEMVHQIDHSPLTPNPALGAAIAALSGGAAIFEDLARNLEVPHALGMTTVLVVPQGTHVVLREEWELAGRDSAHVDYVTDDLTAFLRGISVR